jgi:hypothetical protein
MTPVGLALFSLDHDGARLKIQGLDIRDMGPEDGSLSKERLGFIRVSSEAMGHKGARERVADPCRLVINLLHN